MEQATAPRPLAINVPAWLILAAMAAIFVPGYAGLAAQNWATDEQGHGPIILGVTIWLAWQRRHQLAALPDQAAWAPGLLMLVFGLSCFVVGRSQSFNTLEIFGHIPILAAGLLLTRGWPGLRWGLFFLFFLLFMVPLPGLIVQTITTPLKISVSYVAEALLHAAGYPVARTGVILYVGQYQLLVADACAGLNSMFTLEALGLLYMNLMNYTSAARNITLATLIIPIAFLANVIRVIVLVLVTYYMGDEAGQGFVHGFAGMVLFMVALTLMLATDTLLSRTIFRKAAAASAANAAVAAKGAA